MGEPTPQKKPPRRRAMGAPDKQAPEGARLDAALAGPRVAITGHRSIASQRAASDGVRAAIAGILHRLKASPAATDGGQNGAAGGSGLRVISMLAQGADLLGMQAGLQCGAELDGVLPFDVPSYRTTFDDAAALADFEEMRRHLSSIVTLDGQLGDDGAYVEANAAILKRSDIVIAVWDGAPARGPGGTADVVAHAQALGLPVIVIRPVAEAAPVQLTPDGETPLTPEAVDAMRLRARAKTCRVASGEPIEPGSARARHMLRAAALCLADLVPRRMAQPPAAIGICLALSHGTPMLVAAP